MTSWVPSDDTAARDRFVTLLHERTGGNPFFVRQLVRLIVETEPAATDPSALPVPPGVRHVVASRLKGLSPPVETLLAAAAVIGREFDLRTAAAAAGMTPADALDAFDEAVRHGLVEVLPGDGDHVDSCTPWSRRSCWTGCPTGRAATLHAAVGDQLQRNGTANPDELARHMWAAREVVGSAAIPSQLAAADAAAAVFAHQQAEMHLRRALELARTSSPHDPSTELAVLLSLFRLIAVDRGWGDEDATTVVDRALQLAEAGAYDDDTAPLWWLLFNFLLDRNIEASYVDLARTLLAAVTDPGNSVRRCRARGGPAHEHVRGPRRG